VGEVPVGPSAIGHLDESAMLVGWARACGGGSGGSVVGGEVVVASAHRSISVLT